MKIAAKVQYFGLNYYGFQRQPNHESVQGKLEEALSNLLNEMVLIHGAGRTDRYVSALGQVISFEVKKPIKNLEDFRFHYNQLLPEDIVVTKMVVVDDSFDARHSCIGKRYRYRFNLGDRIPMELGRIAYLGDREFDEKAFKSCLDLYLGVHNFMNFTTKKEDIDGFIRDVKSIELTSQNGIYEVMLESNGFMTYQIRFMIGAALKVAFHKMSLEEVQSYLDMAERHTLSYKAPAEGLVLEEVLYEQSIFA